MSDLKQLGCRIFTTRVSDFYKSDVGFLQLGRWIFTTLLSDFQPLGWHLQASVMSEGSFKCNVIQSKETCKCFFFSRAVFSCYMHVVLKLKKKWKENAVN